MMFLLLLACTAPDKDPTEEIVLLPEPTITTSPLSTVFTVRWTSEEPSVGWVEFGDDTSYPQQTPADAEPVTDHQILVVGLAAGTTQHWRIAEQSGETMRVGADHAVETEAAPEEISLKVTQKAAGWSGFILTPLTDLGVVAIYDGKGRPVWWYDINSGAMMSQAKLIDGSIWFNQFSKEDQGPDMLRTISLDLTEDSFLELTDSHHDFLVYDDRIVYLARDKRTGPDGQTWIGDKLMQRMSDGTVSQIWTSWDSISTEVVSDLFYNDGRDWIHANGLTVWEEQGVYLITSKTQEAIFAIDKESGALSWVMGGVQNTMTRTAGDGFYIIHGPYFYQGNLWVFDNGSGSKGAASYAQEYSIDPEAGTYAELWSHTEDLGSFIHGNVEPLPDDTILASWGESKRLVWVTRDNTVLGRWDTPALGYTHYLSTLGGPVP